MYIYFILIIIDKRIADCKYDLIYDNDQNYSSSDEDEDGEVEKQKMDRSSLKCPGKNRM